MGRSLQLLTQTGGKCSSSSSLHPSHHFNINMKVFAFICCVGLAQSGLVRRDAEPDAEPDAVPDAEADPGYAYAQGAVSAPVCHSVPEKTCVPRQVETPRKSATRSMTRFSTPWSLSIVKKS